MAFRYAAVLFDFDGTLADSYEAITASVNHVRQCRSLPPLPETAVRTLVGHGLLQLMADVIPGSDPEANAALYREHHPSVMFHYTRLLPGVRETIAALHGAGVKLAVCSNKPVAITRSLLTALQLSDCIPLDAAFGPEDAIKPKPAPGMVYLALEKLAVAPDRALFIGDMLIDIDTARNAGLDVWVLPTGSNDEQTLRSAGPDRILKSMWELIEPD